MKKRLLLFSGITSIVIFGLLLNTNFNSVNKMEKLRKQHVAFLDNSPFTETKKLSKKERKALGIAPNKYMERQWELTMDPEDGMPHPERLYAIQDALREQFNRVPGENLNGWVERGPDNVGGRTRAIMYDPNDATNKRVFAGGVSGGLWVNDDITDPNSAWSEVNIPKNLAVSVITYDPNDTNIFYLGTGESYVFNSVNGNGLWKSTDGGVTWNLIFGGAGNTEFQANAKVTVNAPGSIAGEYPVILATAFGGQLGSPVTGDLVLVQDGTGTSEDACEDLTNSGDIAGKIAVIRRGDCSFVDKINRAQTAGAIGVIMVNNIAGEPIPMGGTDAGITIPNVMISRDLGNIIINELGSGVNATMELSGDLLSGTLVPGVQHINDIKVRDIGGGNSEVYVAVGSNGFYDSNPRAYLGMEEAGLYMSNDEGANFTKLALGNAPSGLPLNPNDIELGTDNSIWVSTIENRFFGDGGGLIFSSPDGTTFTQRYAITNGLRTQIAASKTNPNTFYVLARLSSGNALFLAKTVNGFGRVSNITQPQDVDTAPRLDGDFTGGQAFFNLLLEVDPTDDTKLYVGGIDLFRTADSGLNWDQISKWSNNNNLSGLNVSLVHSDQHMLAFNPGDPNQGVYGNDGGVYYASTLSGAATSTSAISPRNNNYNTLQFYKGAIGQEVASEKLLAGAQDNGSQLINNATPGINGSNQVSGGDGAYVFIDKDNGYMISSYVYNVFYYLNYNSGNIVYSIANNQNDGDFINQAALDSDNNVLYANGTDAVPTYQIYRYTLGTNSATRSTLTNALLTRTPVAFKPSTFTTTTLFVGTEDGKLLKLTNANTSPTWSDISGPDFAGSVSCIELGATENDIYVTFLNYGVTSVFYTSDGGTNWSAKEGNLPDLPVRAILANPLNTDEVIVGTELGVWATNNFSSGNPEWHQAQNGMKDVPVTSFDLRTADNTVLASTYGRGMFTGQFDANPSGLSVDEFNKNDLIKVYPTVSSGEITISSITDIREGVVNVYDINGRSVHSTKVNFEGGLEQPLSLNLASGMYVLKFSANEKQSSHKIIIE